jgi:hypothetical protein
MDGQNSAMIMFLARRGGAAINDWVNHLVGLFTSLIFARIEVVHRRGGIDDRRAHGGAAGVAL